LRNRIYDKFKNNKLLDQKILTTNELARMADVDHLVGDYQIIKKEIVRSATIKRVFFINRHIKINSKNDTRLQVSNSQFKKISFLITG